MNSNTFAQANTTETFKALSHLLEAPLINDEILISSARGAGFLKQYCACDGLCVINWNINLHHELHVNRNEANPSKKALHLFYIFTQDQVMFTNTKEEKPEEKNEFKQVVCASSDNIPELIIKPSGQAKLIELIITDNWLSEEYVINNRLPYPFYAILMKQKNPVLFMEPVSCNAYNLLSDIYTNAGMENPDSIYVRTQTLSLLSDIFDGVSKRNTPGYRNNITMQDKMIKVEQILEDHLEKNLPSIRAIAMQVALSESTLKRNFKAAYGTSVYEYYLRQKMKKAVRLFEENPRTVKEVAYMLGYEKVSNFIEIFKKYYHYPPGQLKKIQGG